TGRTLTGSHRQYPLENLLPLALHVAVAADDIAAIDIHILTHAIEQALVTGELQAGHRLEAEGGAPAGSKADDIGAGGHLAGHRYRVVARAIHKGQPLAGHRL